MHRSTESENVSDMKKRGGEEADTAKWDFVCYFFVPFLLIY